ncbi:PLP-dependent aminotransferase family protein [Microbacterium tumbae]
MRPSAIRELLKHGADPGLISFGGGYPDQRMFPVDDLRAALDGLLRPGRADSLQYTASDGLPRLRTQIAERMSAAGTPTGADDVLVLSGGQQGLDLVAKLLIDAGDTVIVENPTFLGALIAFAPFEPDHAAVRIDGEGMDTEHLEQVLRDNPRAKLIYTVPDFHNPTGVTMSLERRRRLIDLANEYDVLVLEDSPYRELRFEGEQPPTLRSLDTEGRVVHLSSFSKILAPGLRLGWLTASSTVREKLGLLKLAADTQSGTLAMAAAAAYLEDHDLDAHVERLRDAYRVKRDLMIRTIDETFPETVERTYPSGGLFTWLTFPDGFDSARFMAEVAVPIAKVAYVPGATFFATDPRPNHARVNFSSATEEQIVEGISRLGLELHRVLDTPQELSA